MFNVFEEVTPTKEFPIVIPQLVASSTWNTEPEDKEKDYQVILRFEVPGEEKNREFPLNIPMTAPRVRCVHTIAGLKAVEAGRIVCKIFLNGDYVASHTITVHEPLDSAIETNPN